MRIWVGLGVVALVATGVMTAQSREQKPEGYSPLGYYDLEQYIRAFPGTPGSLEVRRASTQRFWIYQGLAYKGTESLGAVWESLGPEVTLQSNTSSTAFSVSGRVSAMAISPTCTVRGRCRLWVGTAGGGVWRTDDAMNPVDPGWIWISRGLRTNSIGALALDPNDSSGNTIYVGTGETNSPQNSNAGTGLYRSTNGGDSWTRVDTLVVDPAVSPAPIDFTMTRGISTVVIEPGRPQTMYVATTTAMLGMTAVRGGQSQATGYPQPRPGLYKTDNGGVTWSLIWVPPLDPVLPNSRHLNEGVLDTLIGVRHVKLDPKTPSIVYATAFNNGIYRSAPSLEGGNAAFRPIFATVGGTRYQDFAMFDLTIKDGRTRIYVYNGTENTGPQGLYRVDNADVPASNLATGTGTAITNTSAWLSLSSNDTSQPGSISRAICSAQCFYDLVVAVPEGQPDTVVIGGVASPTFGEPTLRSIDAGARFSGFGRDSQNPRISSHVDVRVVVFHPEDPNIAFTGSDGGVVRNDGSFVDISSRCSALFGSAPQCSVALQRVPQRIFFLNKGLQTMQFYNVALDPQNPTGRLIGGLQDNSTIWYNGLGDPRVWGPLFSFGDGTSASGFHPSRTNVLFASFQSNRFFVNFRTGDASWWVRTDDPIRASDERATVTTSTGRQFLTFDRVNPDTQFTGFQHIWRTQNNGGAQAALEAGCRFPTGAVAGTVCGDWVPLGVAYPFVSQSTPESSSRKPGDLTSDFYGTDREGGIIVAAERSSANGGTLWAATSKGRLFISRNADGPASAVSFDRIDSAATPGRFVTRIIADPADPNAAFVSYTGFNALTPTTPGHVFRVAVNPATNSATYTLLDHDLGDLPINTMAWDHLRGDLYAGTDFGPLVLRRGSAQWTIAGEGFPEVVIVDLEIAPAQGVLVAATHGLGIFSLRIDR
ncbi:MAG: hypothetical protein AMXMBFR57_06950 [Acidimicrobiia bacterium]